MYDTDFIPENADCGDWVLVGGIRKEYPFCMTYSATPLVYDGEGELYADELGEIDPHNVKFVKLINELDISFDK